MPTKGDMQSNIIEQAQMLHDFLYQLQNSGEVDEFECSELTADSDDLLNKIFELFEKWDSH